MATLISYLVGVAWVGLVLASIVAEWIVGEAYQRTNGGSRLGLAIVRVLTDAVSTLIVSTLLWVALGWVGGLIMLALIGAYGRYRVQQAREYAHLTERLSGTDDRLWRG